MKHITLLLALLITTTLSASFYNLAKIPLSTGARCLDGTQYGIYIC